MKILFETIKYFMFFFIVTQLLPKIFNPDNNYNITQMIFLLIVSLGISIKK